MKKGLLGAFVLLIQVAAAQAGVPEGDLFGTVTCTTDAGGEVIVLTIRKEANPLAPFLDGTFVPEGEKPLHGSFLYQENLGRRGYVGSIGEGDIAIVVYIESTGPRTWGGRWDISDFNDPTFSDPKSVTCTSDF